MLELYKNIRSLRIAKGLSQDELAKLVGYSDRTAIAKIESGKVDLPQSKIQLFANALNTTSSALLGYDNENQSSNTDEDSDQQETLAAHFAGDEDLTEEEMGMLKAVLDAYRKSKENK